MGGKLRITDTSYRCVKRPILLTQLIRDRVCPEPEEGVESARCRNTAMKCGELKKSGAGGGLIPLSKSPY